MSQIDFTPKRAKKLSGVKIYANHPTRGRVHVGTVAGLTYTKGLTHKGLLKYPVLSVSIGTDELRDVENAGAIYFVCELSDTCTSHAISLQDFKTKGEWIDRGYGKQIACPLHHFERSNQTGRTVRLNNPPVMPAGIEFERPRPQQLDFFVPRARFDDLGNFRG
jgi:hypothetical protein